MSTRMEWAQERLAEYLRSRETDELMAEFEGALALGERVHNLENGLEGLSSDLDFTLNAHGNRMDDIEDRIEDIEDKMPTAS